MTEMLLPDVVQLIADANAARSRRDASTAGALPRAGDAEARLEARFHVSRVLAVYGTLAPGRPNHHVVEPLGGEWAAGVVEGELSAEGWGAALGYPAFRPKARGAAIDVHVLHSAALPDAWPALDEFEGPGYRRILVPVFRPETAGGRVLNTVANVYAAADEPDGAAR